MASNLKPGYGDWTKYRALPGVYEVDFHFAREEFPTEYYWERMEGAAKRTLNALKQCFEDPEKNYILFTHGWSTSYPGSTTSRSQVRGVMRSKEATPFIVRKYCIQHDSVFLAALRGRDHQTIFEEFDL